MNGDVTVGLGMSVVAALSWGGLDATRKLLVTKLSPVALLVLFTLGQLPLFAGWAFFSGAWIQSDAYVLPGVVSIALNIAANLMFFRAVQLSPLSLTVPLLSFVPVFTVLAANPLLGELPQVQQLVGISVVVLGALTLNAGSVRGRNPLGFVQALFRERGSVPMLGTALCWSLTIVVDKIATRHAGYGAHGVVLNAGIGGVGLALLAMRGRLSELGAVREAWKPWLAAITLGALGLGTQLVAVQHLFVALVESIKRAIGVVMSVIVGRAMFGEPIGVAKLVAVGLMTLGAGIIVWE